MNISDFFLAWRFTDSIYSIFSDDELKKIKIIDWHEAMRTWENLFGNSEIAFEQSNLIGPIVNKTAPVFISDCGWGDQVKEKITEENLKSNIANDVNSCVFLLYNSKNMLSLQTDIFCNRWSDFCYPSDSIIILLKSKYFVYYEDIVYGSYPHNCSFKKIFDSKM